jgi:hypothetical protein
VTVREEGKGETVVTTLDRLDWFSCLKRLHVLVSCSQKGMIRCDILEEPDAAMARFRGGLNCEIQDILDYKEYADMT